MNHAPAIPVWILLLVVLALVGVTACRDDRISPSAATPTPARLASPEPPGSAPPATGPAPTTPASRGIHLRRTADPYLGLGELLHQRGVRIWWETDLVARWLEGPAAFAKAIGRLAVLARQPGTVGIKVADEIGYHDGLDSPAQVLSFLRDVNRALAKAAPRAAILVDAVVLELGCLPRSHGVDECAHRARSTAPAATITAITSYLRAGLINRLDLSTGLGEPDVYPDGDLAAAQSVAWTYVESGPWPELTTLQSRKALAEAGGYSGDAASDVNVFVETPGDTAQQGVTSGRGARRTRARPSPVRRHPAQELPVADPRRPAPSRSQAVHPHDTVVDAHRGSRARTRVRRGRAGLQ